ncbi:MAG: type II toxin-antitoxin system prevent-host-death family antitoxin [Deltaproteobacteria bacterium]|nr:type II toxin-antitoxin system prevent-host-death family antitoxin [Deltaproteobacteria bacterium]
MSPKVLNVSEARRRLPGLVRESAQGGAVAIGARGQATAVLIGIEAYESLRARAAQSAGKASWDHLKLKFAGTDEELEAELRAVRQELVAMPAQRLARKSKPVSKR